MTHFVDPETVAEIGANDIETPQSRLRRRVNARLKGDTMSRFTGGPKGRFLLLVDLEDPSAQPILLLSESLDREVALGERMLAEALLSGQVALARGDWRRVHRTLRFDVTEGSATPRELAECLDERWELEVAFEQVLEEAA